MNKIVKIKHDDGFTAVDLTKIISVSYWKSINKTDICLKGIPEVITIPGNFFDQLCSLIAMVEAEDE